MIFFCQPMDNIVSKHKNDKTCILTVLLILSTQVTMSYLEIYNENIRDLLEPSSGYLELRDESGGRNIQVGTNLQPGDDHCDVTWQGGRLVQK